MKKQIKIFKLGSVTTLTLGTRGGNTEGRRQNWY